MPLYVAGIDDSPLKVCKLEIDGDSRLPVGFRTYRQELGGLAGNAEYGANNRSLLDLKLGGDWVVAGFALVAFDTWHAGTRAPMMDLEVSGRPKLAEPPTTKFSRIAKTNEPFSIGFAEASIEIDLGYLADCDSSIAAGPVTFFLAGTKLGGLGIKCSPKDVETIRSMPGQLAKLNSKGTA